MPLFAENLAERLIPLDYAIFGLYVLGVVVLGIVASRRASGSKRDYFLAGDKLPWWMIGGSIVAANLSSHHLVGAIGAAYDRGFITVCGEWGAILIGLNALLWIFLPFYLRNGFYTMPEFLQRRFGTAPRIVFAILMLLTYLFVEISGVLILGAIALQELLHLNLSLSIIAIAVATGIYTITGGLRAVIWTEMLQLSVLLMGGLALAFTTLYAVGGWDFFISTRDDWHLLLPASDMDFPWTQYLGGALCISTFYFATNQFIVQRVLAAKNEWNARMGIVFTCYLKFIIPLMITVPGLMAFYLVEKGIIPAPERPDMIFASLVVHLLPHGLIGLVLAGLIAAIMGHISGAVNSCSTIATIDLYLPYKQAMKARQAKISSERSTAVRAVSGGNAAIFETESREEQTKNEDLAAIRFGKLFGAMIIFFGILWAIFLSGQIKRPIYIYLIMAYSYFAPGITTMFVMGVFWKRTTYWGATVAGLLTVPLSIVLELIGKFWNSEAISQVIPLSVSTLEKMGTLIAPFANRCTIAFWTCIVVCAVVSLCTKPKPESELQGLIWNWNSLKLPENEKAEMTILTRPGFWWIIITLIVLSFYIMFP
ncbi:MAG: sodium/solute symporter [Planctomycetia bacterium]|nr:sodium/solute symporter [Planctomycetia bacterium]